MKRPRRIFILFVIFVILAAATAYGYRVAHAITPVLQPQGATTIASQTAEVPLAWPNYGEAAVGALGYGVLASHGSDQPLPTASIAKIITALCVLQKYPLKSNQAGPTITLTQKDVDLYYTYLHENGSLVGVAAGEQLTERQALEAMLLPSGNNMADTLADWAFGSLQAYEQHANQFVASLGMKSTRVAGASGFMDTTVSTPHDLVLLGEAAMQNPALASIVGETNATVPVAGKIQNTNLLLGQDGIVGIKTGNSDGDKGALLFAARQQLADNHIITIVGVIMGGPSLPAVMYDTSALINSVVSGFTSQTVVEAGDIVARYDAPWQKGSIAAVAAQDLSVFTWEGRSKTATVQLDALTPPVDAHIAVGAVRIASPDGSTASVPVTLTSPIPAPGLKWKLLHP